jgi:predicted AAA+ superfamily ATPase
MLSLLKSVDPDAKKFFEIYNKYYVGDLGLRNSLVGFDFKRDISKLLENYVYLELKRKGYSIKI